VKFLRDLWDYGWLVLHRVDFVCGGVLAIVYFFVADHIGLGNYSGYVTVVIVLAAFLEASYAVYRQERKMRAEREQNVRLAARLNSLAANIPDPGPDKVSLAIEVYWEMWVDRAVTLDQLGLNVIYVYDRPWWQFLRKTRFPKTGLPRKGQDTTQFRLTIDESMGRPYHDIAAFEYVADRESRESPHWLLEFVIKTGMPVGEYRAAVFIDYDELRSRGTNPPL
jgi:hypothetical protein